MNTPTITNNDLLKVYLNNHLQCTSNAAIRFAREVLALAESKSAAKVAELEAAQASKLRAALVDTLDFVERHSNRWDGVHGKHPVEVVAAARMALAAATEEAAQPASEIALRLLVAAGHISQEKAAESLLLAGKLSAPKREGGV